MRSAISVLGAIALAACGSTLPPPPPDASSGFGAPCTDQSDCTEVCTRNHECLAPDQVRSALVHWTVQGAAASATSCAPIVAAGTMHITFTDSVSGNYTRYSPLMCDAGQFFIDKWPTRFDQVEVGAGTGQIWTGAASLGGAAADVTVDLQPR
jgi:hypothetical protein